MSKLAERIRFFTELSGKRLVDDIYATEKLLKKHEAPPPPPQSWRIIGSVEQTEINGSQIRLTCEQGVAEITVIASNCIRVRVARSFNHLGEAFSYSVAKTNWPDVRYEVTRTPETLTIRTSAMICLIDMFPFQVRLTTPAREVLCADAVGAQLGDQQGVRLTMKMTPDESSYGLGERAASLNLRGRRFGIWNTDIDDYNRDSDPLYYNVPFYLGVHQHGVYGVFWDNASRGIVDTGQAAKDELLFESESGELRYYLFAGTDINSVVGRYTELTGRIALPPMWFLGLHQSRFSYQSASELLALAQEFRKRGIPSDVLYLDIHYMDEFRAFTWDQSRFPDPSGMIKQLQRDGFKVIAILDPGIRIEPDDPTFRSGLEQDVFLRYPDGERVSAAVWPGLCHFPDFTRPEARAWWAQQCQALLDNGIDGIWNDMCEPVVFLPDGGATLPDKVIFDGDSHPATHREYHNVYGTLMARASAEAIKQARPNRRAVNIVRAGFAGVQRYASTWTGDNASDWDHLRLSLSMVMNMGLSGAPITGPDIGGFRGNANGELLTRWLQAAAFFPYFRIHSAFGTNAQEPWSHGQPYEVINRLTIELRYRFLPYLYSVIAQAKEYGWPVIRPLFTAEPFNPDLRDIDDCYMVGEAVLVAPVVRQGAVNRSVYLPDGQWYDYWTNELLDGGEVIQTPSPLERLPLFIRAGTVLPQWRERPFIDDRHDEELTLRVYPGSFETILYEDRGEGTEYENGDYRWIYMTSNWEDDTLTINRRIAGRFTPPYRSIRLEIVGLDDEPASVRVDRKGAPLWFYDDGMLELIVNEFQRLEIEQKPTTTDRTIASRPR